MSVQVGGKWINTVEGASVIGEEVVKTGGGKRQMRCEGRDRSQKKGSGRADGWMREGGTVLLFPHQSEG